MPIREYICSDCGHIQEFLMGRWDPEDTTFTCVHCDSPKLSRLPPVTGGYHIIGSNTSSVRPKGAGSRPRGSK